MIRVPRGRAPQSLTGRQSPGAIERAAAIAFFRVRANRGQSYDQFVAYKKPDVVATLNQRFRFKCAYCESTYAAVSPVDVEHYRPKGGIEVNGQLQKPGYYWLAAEWTNLLPSCIDCNRKRTHDFPDADPALRGKANKFPIANPDRRAARPGGERRERRLLLHPCLDRPDVHLEFITEGAIRAALVRGTPSEMGRASIEVYGLDRPGLAMERQRILRYMEGHMANISRLRGRLATAGTDRRRRRELEEDIGREMAQLKSFQEPDQPYSEMARQAIARFLDNME